VSVTPRAQTEREANGQWNESIITKRDAKGSRGDDEEAQGGRAVGLWAEERNYRFSFIAAIRFINRRGRGGTNVGKITSTGKARSDNSVCAR